MFQGVGSFHHLGLTDFCTSFRVIYPVLSDIHPSLPRGSSSGLSCCHTGFQRPYWIIVFVPATVAQRVDNVVQSFGVQVFFSWARTDSSTSVSCFVPVCTSCIMNATVSASVVTSPFLVSGVVLSSFFLYGFSGVGYCGRSGVFLTCFRCGVGHSGLAVVIVNVQQGFCTGFHLLSSVALFFFGF